MLNKLQAISGLIFATFVAVHLLNTCLASLGPGAYDGGSRGRCAWYTNFLGGADTARTAGARGRGRHADDQGTDAT